MNEKLIYADHVPADTRTARDLVQRLNGQLMCHASDLYEAVLVLISYTRYMTAEEICQLYPISSSVLYTGILPKLIKDKQIKKEQFDRPRGDSRNYYIVTRRGVLDNHAILSQNKPKYKAPRSAMGNVAHSYYTGYNLFQMLKHDFVMEWYPEYIGEQYYDIRASKSRQDILQVDALLKVENGRKIRDIYIEEDTCSEKASILLDKLERYLSLGYMYDPKDMIIFSCVNPKATGCALNRRDTLNPYSWKKTAEIVRIMEENNIDDARELLKNGSHILSEKERLFLDVLFDAIGADPINEMQVNRDFLKEYIKSLKISTNPYKQALINKEHADFARIRLNQLAKDGIENFTKRAWIRPVLYGYPVLCIPTTLLADRIRYSMLSDFPKMQETLVDTLSPYFKDLKFVGDVSEPIELTNDFSDTSFRSLRLRNHFSYRATGGKKGSLYIESPFTDAGSWIRCYLYLRFYRTNDASNIICIFENEQQAGMFYKMFDYEYDSMNIETNKSGIFGLNFYDLDKKLPLYIIDSFYDEKRTFVTSV